MFFNNQSEEQKKEYEKFLKIAGCLSQLFSDSKIPYLYYRLAERVFCRAFDAEDLSRSDVSADAKKNGLGIGLKTFLMQNNRTLQKVAEFNKDKNLYDSLEPEELVKKIAELRNARIDFTESTHGMKNSIYHCVLRDSGKFKIFEEEMNRIDIDNIVSVKKKGNSISFKDGIHEYFFSLSKSTLLKRFITDSVAYEFNVDILEDPLLELNRLLSQENLLLGINDSIKETIYLPLYSERRGEYFIPKKSGLNQWNAAGRSRDLDEVYIRIPSWVHEKFPNFFPSRDVSFNLKFPDGEILSSKVCQQGSKALMTNPNKKLGKLILRDGLKLEKGKLVTYDDLRLFGMDSIRLDKISDLEFEINFSESESYENFKEEYKNDF